MTGFPLAWLDLREAADHRARDAGLARSAAAILDRAADPLAVDLGSGAGSTVRALAPLLTRPVRWRLVDNDAALLDEASRRAEASSATVETVLFELAAPAPLPLAGATMVTSSALVDLVSTSFLERLVAAAAAYGAVVYAALGYNGAMAFSPVHPLDDDVLAAFNRDQARDKGFGPALGPAGAATLADLLRRAGYQVRTAASPWRLGGADRALVEALVRGIATAVSTALDPGSVDDWLNARLASAATGTAEIGHIDVLGVFGRSPVRMDSPFVGIGR